MRIAYVTSVYARASDTFIRNEVCELRDRGHCVHTFSIRRDASDASVSDEIRSEQAGTDYIVERGALTLALSLLQALLLTPLRFFRTFRLAWQTRPLGIIPGLLQCAYLAEAAYLARRLLQLRIEILHNHIAENSATVAMLASTLSGVPFSMTVHGPGIFFHPQRWALGEKIARASFTVCISNFCRSQCMIFSPPATWPKLHVVRCAVGRTFEDVEPRPIPERPRLIFVGRLCVEKGVTVLIDAVARYVRGGGRCELVVVGDGPLRPDIEQLIEQQGLQGTIHLAGWRSSNQVRTEIELSRALILPSCAEGLPLVIMEALALGRPVISTQIAGIPELVESGANGWLIPAGSTEALIDAIHAVATCAHGELARLGRNGRDRVRDLHRLRTQIDSLERLMLVSATGAST